MEILVSEIAFSLGALITNITFSVIEQQAIITELIEHFVFELPPDKPEIQRMPSGIVMVPMIRDKIELGTQMPLLVKMVK